MDYCPSMAADRYMADQEEAAWGEVLGKIEDALKAQNEGRCSDFLVSFGYKHADLEPEGCTGIKSLITADDDSITVLVGGHKVFCYSTSDDAPELPVKDQVANILLGCDDDWVDRQAEDERELLCNWAGGYDCEGDEEQFSASFEAELKVDWEWDDDGENYEKTAENIIEKAREAVATFEKDMAAASDALDKFRANNMED